MWWLLLFFLMFATRDRGGLGMFKREREKMKKLGLVPDSKPAPRRNPAPASPLPCPASVPYRPVRTQAEAYRDATIGLLLLEPEDFRKQLLFEAQRRIFPQPPRAPFVPSTSNPPETTSTVQTSIFCLTVPPGDCP
jgi:hypothetical protein